MSSATGPSRIEWVDAGRAISIFLVVLTHSEYWLHEGNYVVRAPFNMNAELTEMALVTFFFASGVFAGRALEGSWRNLLRSRVVPLAWLFLVWQVIAVGYSVAAGLLIQDNPVGSTLVRSLVKPFVSLVRPSNELWFLWALLAMFVIAKFLSRLDWRLRLALAAAPAVVVYGLVGSQLQQAEELVELGWIGLAKYTVVFVAAALIGRRGAAALERLPIVVSLPVAVGALAALIALSTVPLGALRVVLLPVELVAGIAFAVAFARVTLLQRLGALSLPVFVLHTSVLVVFVIVARYGAEPINRMPGAEYLVPVIVAVAAVAGSLAVYRLLLAARADWLFDAPIDRLMPPKISPESR